VRSLADTKNKMSNFNLFLKPDSDDEEEGAVKTAAPKAVASKKTTGMNIWADQDCGEDDKVDSIAGDVVEEKGGQEEGQYQYNYPNHEQEAEAEAEAEAESVEEDSGGEEDEVQLDVRVVADHVQPDIFQNALGQDGKFAIIRDAMGVPGLDIAVNVLAPDNYEEMLKDESFTLPTTKFVEDQKRPLQRSNLSSDSDIDSSWSPMMWQVFNAVRDSGLYPEAATPGGAYILHYPPGSEFPLHFDSRYRWGEYVCVYSLCAPVLLRFQWVKGHMPAALGLDLENPGPNKTVLEALPSNSYYRHAWGPHPHSHSPAPKVSSYVAEMVLPPNSFYVMAGDSRKFWRHGLKSLQTINNKKDEANPRRAIVFREVKVFNVLSLEAERDRLKLKGSSGQALKDIQDRLTEMLKYDTVTESECGVCNSFLEILVRRGSTDENAFKCSGIKKCKKCKEEHNSKRRVDHEIMKRIAAAFKARMERLRQNPVHQVRFRPEAVNFPDRGKVFAPGDPFADDVGKKTERELEAIYYPPKLQRSAGGAAAASSAFSGPGRRLGGGGGGAGGGVGVGDGGQGRQRKWQEEEEEAADPELQQALLASINDLRGGGGPMDDDGEDKELEAALALSMAESMPQKRHREAHDVIDLT